MGLALDSALGTALGWALCYALGPALGQGLSSNWFSGKCFNGVARFGIFFKMYSLILAIFGNLSLKSSNQLAKTVKNISKIAKILKTGNN